MIKVQILSNTIGTYGRYAAFLPAVNMSSQPVNLSRMVSRVIFTTGELGASRNFPICDLNL